MDLPRRRRELYVLIADVDRLIGITAAVIARASIIVPARRTEDEP